MLNDPVLINDWHIVAYASDLKEGQPMAVRLLGEDLALWRVGDKIHAWRDLCSHRGTRLSLGRIEQQCLICPYHGWTYNEQGQCIRYPISVRLRKKRILSGTGGDKKRLL